MSEPLDIQGALDKAKGACAAAKDLLDEAEPDGNGLLPKRDLENYSRLVNAASVQANIAQAEAMESIAVSLEKLANPPFTRMPGAAIGGHPSRPGWGQK